VEQLCSKKHTVVIRPENRGDLLSQIKNWPQDLYVVGLDNHVGFLLIDEDGVWFIHSNYMNPFGVTRELAQYSQAFGSETYVIGNLTNSEYFLNHWLNGTELTVER